VVAIDPSAPFAAAIRRVLPAAWLVVDHWHLHRLANQMLTRVRQRATQQVHGHRAGSPTTPGHIGSCSSGTAGPVGPAVEPAAPAVRHRRPGRADRRCLGRPVNRQELLRPLLVDSGADARPYEIRARLERFYACAEQVDIPELTTLAAPVETWWPEILGFLQLRITNARTDGYNRTSPAGSPAP
jgi:transposase